MRESDEHCDAGINVYLRNPQTGESITLRFPPESQEIELEAAFTGRTAKAAARLIYTVDPGPYDVRLSIETKGGAERKAAAATDGARTKEAAVQALMEEAKNAMEVAKAAVKEAVKEGERETVEAVAQGPVFSSDQLGASMLSPQKLTAPVSSPAPTDGEPPVYSGPLSPPDPAGFMRAADQMERSGKAGKKRG